jgi:hypothetical protein
VGECNIKRAGQKVLIEEYVRHAIPMSFISLPASGPATECAAAKEEAQRTIDEYQDDERFIVFREQPALRQLAHVAVTYFVLSPALAAGGVLGPSTNLTKGLVFRKSHHGPARRKSFFIVVQ